jgi:hypothetical protein
MAASIAGSGGGTSGVGDGGGVGLGLGVEVDIEVGVAITDAAADAVESGPAEAVVLAPPTEVASDPLPTTASASQPAPKPAITAIARRPATVARPRRDRPGVGGNGLRVGMPAILAARRAA